MGQAAGTGAEAGAAASSELEIEKKFPIPDAAAAARIEERLSALGFRASRREEFADWYFDLPAPGWHFSLNDCWFRYREKKVKVLNNWGWRGAWQVKRGRTGEHADGLTVYEEMQGKEAKELMLDMLAELGDIKQHPAASEDDTSPPWSAFDAGYDVPHLAGAESLVPFARLETFRTCYEPTEGCPFGSLKVDIDKTDFGYMVGEVEAVLGDGSDDKASVDEAKESIRKLVTMIASEDESEKSSQAMGKLEYYLIKNHKDHYAACVEAGVIGAVAN
ncbi:hypothetical protein ACHAXT_000656 [Thalassiosira profunda]